MLSVNAGCASCGSDIDSDGLRGKGLVTANSARGQIGTKYVGGGQGTTKWNDVDVNSIGNFGGFVNKAEGGMSGGGFDRLIFKDVDGVAGSGSAIVSNKNGVLFAGRNSSVG